MISAVSTLQAGETVSQDTSDGIVRLARERDTLAELIDDVREGLSAQPKRLPPKWFYDARGSRLFEEITRLPEYYLTRAETEILEANAAGLVEAARPEELTEIGSGSSRKTQLLLEAMHRLGTGARYVAFDVSEPALRSARRSLAARYPWLEVRGVVGDFEVHLPLIPRGGTRLVAFLGSTVGNLDEGARRAFFATVGALLEGGDRFLLGADLVKDRAVLEAAYDDSSGVTAAFNRNVLEVLNRELDANFAIDEFDHVARYDADLQRIEMHLRARRDLEVLVPGADMTVRFEKGELMLTEISSKFTREQVERELAAAGLVVERWLTDSQRRFGLALARRTEA